MSYVSLVFLCAVQEDGRSWERHRANSRVLRGEARENYFTFHGVCVTRIHWPDQNHCFIEIILFYVPLSFCPTPDISNAKWQGDVIPLIIIYLNVQYFCHNFALCNPNGCKICYYFSSFCLFIKKLLCVTHFTQIAQSLKNLFTTFHYCYQLL